MLFGITLPARWDISHPQCADGETEAWDCCLVFNRKSAHAQWVGEGYRGSSSACCSRIRCCISVRMFVCAAWRGSGCVSCAWTSGGQRLITGALLCLSSPDFYFFNFLIYLMRMNTLPVYMKCTSCVQCLQRSEKGIRSSGTEEPSLHWPITGIICVLLCSTFTCQSKRKPSCRNGKLFCHEPSPSPLICSVSLKTHMPLEVSHAPHRLLQR